MKVNPIIIPILQVKNLMLSKCVGLAKVLQLVELGFQPW